MTRKTWLLMVGGLAGSALLAAAVAVAYAQQQGQPPKKDDRTKGVIEAGPKNVIAPVPVPGVPGVPVPAAVAAAYYAKGTIEQPLENTLAKGSEAGKDTGAAAFVNPKVQPGKVKWHKDFAEACQASARSGKPVLLFHMMGRLDDRFC